MNDKTCIVCGDEIPTGRLTLVYKHDIVEDAEYGGAFPLEFEHATFHADRCSDEGVHPRTMPLLAAIFYGYKSRDNFDPLELAKMAATPWSAWPKTKATRHLFGLIDMTLKVNQPLVWITPEAFLTPAQQCQLGDVLIALT